MCVALQHLFQSTLLCFFLHGLAHLGGTVAVELNLSGVKQNRSALFNPFFSLSAKFNVLMH